jgi:hypothetical protein
MATYKKKPVFIDTIEGVEFEKALHTMVKDEAYLTTPSFSTNINLYPNNLIPFVNKHMDYIQNHPSIDPQQYLSNLRLMTRIRSSASIW